MAVMTGNQIAVVVAPVLLLVLGTYFIVSYRRNQRMADREFGGLTETESSLGRVHAIAIMAVLVISMGLAVGAATSTVVRHALADVGERSRWVQLALIPAVLLYARWLTRAISRASRERRRR